MPNHSISFPRDITELNKIGIENFKFPIYLKNERTGEYYRYSSGNRVLQFNKLHISSHCGPFIFMDKMEFFRFLMVFKSRHDIIPVSEEEFKDELIKSVELQFANGIDPKEFWSKEEIKINNQFLKQRTETE